MTLPLRSALSLALFAVLFGTFSPARAGTAGIQDNAGFFSENAKSDAGRNIRELQRTVNKDVCVETFAEIPADVRQGVNLQDKAAMNRLFDQWAVKRAREQSVNGVYMLLVKQPAHLQVVVGNETQKQAFTLADRDALVSTMLAKLRAKDHDAALREGVSFVASTMKNHARSHALPASAAHRSAEPESSGSSSLLTLVIIGLVAWVAFGLIRSLFGRGKAGGSTAEGGMTPTTPGGGGGFGRSMLGGLFGAAAGMWMYDQFFGGSSAHAASPQDHSEGSGTGDSSFSEQDTDYSSSGGDFGGGDAGGGGGDF